MRTQKVFAVLVGLGLFATAGSTLAADAMVFDSTDNYLGGCSRTDASTWTLPTELQVSTFQIWYYWESNERELPVTVLKDGQPFASFTATRGNCDPYQQSWCNADYALNRTMPAGTYTTKIPNARQCLKPGGTGTVRLYGAEVSGGAAPTTETPAPSQPAGTVPCTGGGSTIELILGIVVVIESAVIYLKLIRPKSAPKPSA
jgi:hypothetical protein